MGTIVDIASTHGSGDNASATGYLSLPSSGSGPGVLVIQEWWGLDSGIKEMTDRLAVAGFVALAPDLYRGEIAGHTEMDKAGELMNALPLDRAAADMSVAIDFLAAHDATDGDTIGVVGFCMGGMLSFFIAADRPDVVRAVVPFYGFPTGEGQPDYSLINAAIQGHMAERDDFFPPEAAHELEQRLRSIGLDASLTVYPGTGHAFMAPHNAMGTQDEDLYEQIWPRAMTFLHAHLA